MSIYAATLTSSVRKNTIDIIMLDFAQKYEELEKCLKKQVRRDRKRLRCDDIVYLPQFIRPNRPVDYIFIAMEPSLTTKWAGKRPNRKDGEAAIKKGFRNYLPASLGGCFLHYCAKNYLCTRGQTYYITDMSKGAMPVDKAKHKRKERWEEWFPLLKKELELVAKQDAIVFAMGREVERFLTKKREQGEFDYRLQYLLHPSNQAAGARQECIAGRKSEFNKFKQTMTKEKLEKFASKILSKDSTKWAKRRAKERLESKNLTDSWKMLMFCYKLTFEGCK